MALLRGNTLCECRGLLLSGHPAGSETIMTSGRLSGRTLWSLSRLQTEGRGATRCLISRHPAVNSILPTTTSAPSMASRPLRYAHGSLPPLLLGLHGRQSGSPVTILRAERQARAMHRARRTSWGHHVYNTLPLETNNPFSCVEVSPGLLRTR